MAAITGSVRLTGVVAPSDSTDEYAVIDPKYGIDGWRSVANITERDAISTLRRRQGMIVHVQSENKQYQLQNGITNSNWTETFDTGSFNIIKLPKTNNALRGVVIQSSSILVHTYCSVSQEVAPSVVKDQNFFIGKDAGNFTNTGVGNYCCGQLCGSSLISGSDNVFMGFFAGMSTTNGISNVYIGGSAGVYNTTGEYQTFIGAGAGFASSTGTFNTFLGSYAGNSNNGDENTMIGVDAGIYNGGGSLNVFIGNETAYNNSGSNNVIIGAYAGYNSGGTGNVFIGYNVAYNEIGSNKLYIDNSNTTKPLIYGKFDTDYIEFNANITHASGNLGVHNNNPTISDGYGIHVGGKILRLDTSKTPASPSASGYAGEICWDTNYIYVCVATNTWKRSALSW